MLLLKKIIGFLIPVLFILAMILLSSEGFISIIVYTIISLLLSLFIILLSIVIYFSEMNKHRKEPKKLVVAGIVMIAIFFGYGLFIHLMGVKFLIVYDSVSKNTVINLDDEITIIIKNPIHNDKFNIQGTNDFAYNDRYRVKSGTSWSYQESFKIEYLGFGVLAINVFNHEIIYKKNRGIFIDRQKMDFLKERNIESFASKLIIVE